VKGVLDWVGSIVLVLGCRLGLARAGGRQIIPPALGKRFMTTHLVMVTLKRDESY
jgi:hypothetical protein